MLSSFSLLAEANRFSAKTVLVLNGIHYAVDLYKILWNTGSKTARKHQMDNTVGMMCPTLDPFFGRHDGVHKQNAQILFYFILFSSDHNTLLYMEVMLILKQDSAKLSGAVDKIIEDLSFEF